MRASLLRFAELSILRYRLHADPTRVWRTVLAVLTAASASGLTLRGDLAAALTAVGVGLVGVGALSDVRRLATPSADPKWVTAAGEVESLVPITMLYPLTCPDPSAHAVNPAAFTERGAD